jgi:hypothetical protein
LQDPIRFVIVAKKKGKVQDPGHGKNLINPDTGKSGAMNLTDSHFSQYIKLITGDSPRIQLETDLPLARFPQPSIQFSHLLHPRGSFRRNGRKLNEVCACGMRISWKKMGL